MNLGVTQAQLDPFATKLSAQSSMQLWADLDPNLSEWVDLFYRHSAEPQGVFSEGRVKAMPVAQAEAAVRINNLLGRDDLDPARYDALQAGLSVAYAEAHAQAQERHTTRALALWAGGALLGGVALGYLLKKKR